MYEPHRKPPLSRARFLRRLVFHGVIVLALLVFSLIVGIAGYAYFENLSCLDGFLNSAMLLGGMGPVDAPKTPGGKLFAGLYALYAGLVFLIFAGVLLVPVLHGVLHRFHWEIRDEK